MTYSPRPTDHVMAESGRGEDDEKTAPDKGEVDPQSRALIVRAGTDVAARVAAVLGGRGWWSDWLVSRHWARPGREGLVREALA